MVADKIDMSLDDIISTNRKGRGRGRGVSRGGRGNSNFRRGGGVGPVRTNRGGGRGGGGARNAPYTRPRNVPDKWEHDMYETRGRNNTRTEGGSGGLSTGTQLQISNLDFGVTESDIRELFSEFGKLKKAMINYDASGRSHGTANVVFERQVDATKAITTYNNVPLDGRPMKIEAVTTAKAVVAASNNSFGGRTNTFNNRRGNRGGVSGNNDRRSSFGRNNRGGRGGRGGGGTRGSRGGNQGSRGGNQGGRGRRGRPTPSKDDLDKELDSYIDKGDN